jgi:alanine-synthesizing transaminase
VRPEMPATVLDAEGGWYAVLRVPATVPEEERVVALLEDHGVLVHPGFFFDFPAEAYLVLSLLPPPDAFEEGASRLTAVL